MICAGHWGSKRSIQFRISKKPYLKVIIRSCRCRYGSIMRRSLSVTLSDVDLGIGVNIITINFENVDGLINGGSTTVEYTQNCTDVTATLNIIYQSMKESQ